MFRPRHLPWWRAEAETCPSNQGRPAPQRCWSPARECLLGLERIAAGGRHQDRRPEYLDLSVGRRGRQGEQRDADQAGQAEGSGAHQAAQRRRLGVRRGHARDRVLLTQAQERDRPAEGHDRHRERQAGQGRLVLRVLRRQQGLPGRGSLPAPQVLARPTRRSTSTSRPRGCRPVATWPTTTA